MKPVFSMNVLNGKQGNDAKVVVSCQQVMQVVLPMESQDAIRDWLTDVFNSDASVKRVEIYEDGSVMGD